MQFQLAYHIQSLAINQWESALDTLAQLDYKGIEAKQLPELEGKVLEDIQELLQTYNLKLTALTSGGDIVFPDQREEIIRNALEIAAILQKVNASSLVIETGSRDIVQNTKLDFKVASETLNELGKRCMDNDVYACIHPHIGHRIENEEDIDRIMNLVDTREVFLCLDSGHLALAGENPSYIFQTYGSCLKHVHFQDFCEMENELGPSLQLCNPGQGQLDFSTISRILDELHYDNWVTIESEDTDTLIHDARISMDSMKKFLKEFR